MGIWDVDELAEKMSVDLLYEWMAFFQVSPFGDSWLRDAMAMAQRYNSFRSASDRPMQPADFMPLQKREQSPEAMLGILRSIPR